MLQFIAALCSLQVCYIAPDYSVIQIPVATISHTVHPDDTLSLLTENGILIKFVPVGQEI